MSAPSITGSTFREICIHAMNELIAQGSIDSRDSLPELSLDDFASQLPVTARSIVQEDGETSEEYAEKLVYFTAKDAIEIAVCR